MIHFKITMNRTRDPEPCELPSLEDIDSIPCIPMSHDKTLLEEMGIGPKSTADEYCRIIETYKRGYIREAECWSMLSRLGRIAR